MLLEIEQSLKPLEPTFVKAEKVDTCADSYKITIISQQFEGLRTLQRHRKVNALIKEFMHNIHALELVTRTPNENDKEIK